VLAVLRKFSLNLMIQFTESISTVYGSPFFGKTKISCEFGKGIANLHAA
jgi:hypothetical protein